MRYLFAPLILPLLFAPLQPLQAKKDYAAPVPIPDTADALWTQIDAQRKALGDAITGGNALEAAKDSDTLKQLVKAILTKYPTLPAEKVRSIHHETKSVGHLCDDVREALAEKNADKLNAILQQIDGALKFVRNEVTQAAKK